MPEAAAGRDWHVEAPTDPAQSWIHVRCRSAHPPAQGWKLHVSAGVPTAEGVLRRALPILVAENVTFKVAASLRSLARLNHGFAGLSQVGKFLTVYPDDDIQAVRVATALDDATRGLRGPAVPSDQPLRAGSLVHYRFGGFVDARVPVAGGDEMPAIRQPDGELVPDRRGTVYRSPEWAVDPFIAGGLGTERPPRPALIGGRYLFLEVLAHSARGDVLLVIDVETPKTCVLKQARANALLDADGRDARDRLRLEARVLAVLSPDPRFPALFEMFEEGDDLYLAMEDVEGLTVADHVADRAARGCIADEGEVLAWGVELASMLAALHSRSVVHRDLKAENVVVSPGGTLRLIDFDIAGEAGEASPHHLGTRGYCSPEQEAGAAPSVLDDVYSLGALLYFVATGAEPAVAPRPFSLLDRPVDVMNPRIGPSIGKLIARCLAPVESRLRDMSEVTAALRSIVAVPGPPVAFGAEHPVGPVDDVRGIHRDMARRIGDSLCRAAQQTTEHDGAHWVSRYPLSNGFVSPTVYSGSGGVVLALAELVDELGDAGHRQALRDGARWIAATADDEPTRPGLFAGTAGTAAALLRASQVLDDGDLLAAATSLGRRLGATGSMTTSPDTVSGSPGDIRVLIWLSDETHDPAFLELAVELGKSVVAAAETVGGGALRWLTPAGHGRFSEKHVLGYAHGAAGVGDALLELFEATGERSFLEGAEGAARWLAQLAVATLPDGSGLNWPRVEGDSELSTAWCHGAAGIGTFLLRLAAVGDVTEAATMAAGAARTVGRGARWTNPTHCHGLAGNIGFLLDMFQATGEVAYRNEAMSLARILRAFSLEQDGSLVWPSESPETITPDYMVGYAGVAVCLLRLADAESRPSQLSRPGFRWRALRDR